MGRLSQANLSPAKTARRRNRKTKVDGILIETRHGAHGYVVLAECTRRRNRQKRASKSSLSQCQSWQRARRLSRRGLREIPGCSTAATRKHPKLTRPRFQFLLRFARSTK